MCVGSETNHPVQETNEPTNGNHALIDCVLLFYIIIRYKLTDVYLKKAKNEHPKVLFFFKNKKAPNGESEEIYPISLNE